MSDYYTTNQSGDDQGTMDYTGAFQELMAQGGVVAAGDTHDYTAVFNEILSMAQEQDNTQDGNVLFMN